MTIWEDLNWRVIIKTQEEEIVCEGVEWIHLVNDLDTLQAVVKTLMNIWVP